MRLFVAVNLPHDERARLHDATRPLRETAAPVRWVEPDALHVTVKFLGEVPEERCAGVSRALDDAAVGAGPFDLRIGGVGAFPNLHRPRVFWLAVADEPRLAALQRRVEDRLAPLGFPAEDRAFRPHLTIGRARDARPEAFRKLAAAALAVVAEARAEVHTVDLMQSHPGRGARYERIHAAPLGGC